MCSKEELIKRLIQEASVLTDEEVAEVLEYARVICRAKFLG